MNSDPSAVQPVASRYTDCVIITETIGGGKRYKIESKNIFIDTEWIKKIHLVILLSQGHIITLQTFKSRCRQADTTAGYIAVGPLTRSESSWWSPVWGVDHMVP
jgi:hypothetical protein